MIQKCSRLFSVSRSFYQRFSSDKNQGNYGVKLDEESIKRKMKQIKERQKNGSSNEGKKPQLLKNYKLQKVKSETKKFRQSTNTENLFQIEDVSLDEKPTIMQINSYNSEMIEVDQFPYPPSLILTPHQLLIWELQTTKQMKVDHLKIVELLNPPPAYIIVGTDKLSDVPREINEYLKSLGVNYDILEMFEAVSNYNTYANDEIPLIGFFHSTL